uniref:Transcription cofactor n=1 Tax=Rhizophora mucronata TaxID=61149 RepID=A0A2P2MQJ5_RHIMU
MDTNNWRPAAPGGEPAMEAGDWRAQLPPDSRLRIVNKIMDTLKRHLPLSVNEGLQELQKIARRFEEKIYSAATNQSDYLRKISMKMLTMETKSQNSLPNSLPSNAVGNSNKTPDPGVSRNLQPQVNNQGQSIPIPLPANQSQGRQQLLSQNMQNNMTSSGVQSSAGLPSALSTVSGLNQSPLSSVVGPNTNMPNVCGIAQNSVGSSMGQGVPSNIFANHRQITGRQQVTPQQQQQQSQNPQQYLYQQQMQHQLMNQKLQQGNAQHTLMQSHMQQQQQQQQQNLLQSTQLQSSQQLGMQTSSVMQPSMMQSAPLSSLQQSAQSMIQQNQPSSVLQSSQSVLQQHPPSVLRQPQQASSLHQQQAQIMQQQQQLLGQQNSTSMQQNQLIGQQNQLIGQQNSVGDLQHHQQRLLGQQNNLQNLPQQQQLQQQQQQLMPQQNNLSSMHQQQLGPQNIPGLQQPQQQQLLGTQSGNSGMQNNQHSMHMLPQSKIQLQSQTPQNATNLLPSQGQQSQPQPPQQQMMSQMPSQPAQLQQQLGLQQQSNQLQQRLHASAALDSTAQTGHVNGGDWQEEVYQKIKAMRETYYPELNEMYQKIAAKLHLHESLPQQAKTEQYDKLKTFKSMLERTMAFLQLSKSNITPNMKDKLLSYEKQIITFINPNRPRKPTPSLQQGQLPQPHMQPMQQAQSQIPQVQSHENQINPQLQTMNLQGSVPTMQQNNMSSLQHNPLSSVPGISTSQQMMNAIQPGSNLDSGQGNTLGSLQQMSMGSLQQNAVSAPQQANINTMSSQSGANMLQPSVPVQSNSTMPQHQHLKQQHEQQMLQSHQFKQQLQQRQLQQQLIKQQMQQQQQQQLNQQAKQQLPAQMTQQMSQLHQMTDANELKMRQGIGIKPGVFPQHLPMGQRTAFPHQQMKSGGSYPISSPQLLPAASPQLPQHSSPQVDHQNLLPSLTKTGTPLQSANSPFIVPSPSTPLAPSPALGDSEKPFSGISSLSNAGNVGHQQTVTAQATAPSLAIGTPGISASPLLAEFTGTDGAHGTALTTVSSKSSVTEQPLERLMKAVKSMSPKARDAAISDISSVVCMTDRIAGSAPGNGSRAAVGEDLVAMTKCRLQARNFITQDGMSGTRKMRRYTSAMPLNVLSSAGSMSDGYKQLNGPEASDLESTATSGIKRPRIEVNQALLEEIREINQRLIDTVIDISDEDVDPSTAAAAAAEGGEGTIVKCSFIAVALSPNLKSQYASAQMSPIQPLRLLVPTNYPNCSPILLDKLPIEVSKDCEDLSKKAKSRLSAYLQRLSQPMSVSEIARSWDVCTRAVICEHAQQYGGGSFSSRYGTWDRLGGA